MELLPIDEELVMPYNEMSRYADPWDEPYAGYERERPGWRPDAREVERVTHLVLVDGRPVEVWTEPVDGTRWEEHAERFARERRPDPPPTPQHLLLLTWLAQLCGGHPQLEALTDAPLPLGPGQTPPPPDEAAVTQLQRVDALLSTVTQRCFDDETGIALTTGVRLMLVAEPAFVLTRPPEQVAGGLCWAVGKVNGLFGSDGVTTQTAVRSALGTRSAIDPWGAAVRQALAGWRGWDRRPHDVPDLLPLGRVELLTSRTRRRLVSLREAARREQALLEGTASPGQTTRDGDRV